MCVQVPELSLSNVSDIISASLKHVQRCLSNEQKRVVIEAFQHCPLPLFLKISLHEAFKWKSYHKLEDTVLQHTVKGVIETLFERLERLHGKTLVKHALGLLTASKYGLSDAEIDDILSISDEVLDDVYQFWTPPRRRIPPLSWLRLRAELEGYIVSRDSGGTLVNVWYHRQFVETAECMYLTKGMKEYFHKLLRRYFSGTASVEEKERLVAAQPNIFLNDSSSKVVFNRRKLSELPRHLICANEVEELKKYFLFNIDFLFDKIRALGYQNLLRDCLEAKRKYPNDKDVVAIYVTLNMAAPALAVDSNQLPCQLIGRLYDHQTSPSVINLLENARMSNIKCLYPSQQCFIAPDMALLFNLIGHEEGITYSTFTSDSTRLISTSL